MEELNDVNVCVVLPASGCGVRMGMLKPKQYLDILNKPLLLFSVNCFHRVGWIKQIIITVDQLKLEFVKNLMKEEGFDNVTVVEGGSTRHRSIFAGIKALKNVCPEVDVVLIHDSVRPLADTDVITKVSIAAKQHGSAGVVRPLVSTVIAVDETGLLNQSLDRNQYRASEMPQGFQYELIKTAYEKSSESDFEFGTECLQLVLAHTGTRAKLVEGPSSLWKVTHRKDMYAAEGILKERYLHVCIVNGSEAFTCELNSYLKIYDIKSSHCGNTSSLMNSLSDVTDLILPYPVSAESDIEASLTTLPQKISHLTGVRKLISTPVIVLVYLCSDEMDLYDQYAGLHQKLTLCKDGNDRVIPVAVLTKVKNNRSKLCDLLKHLVWDRRACMTGQVLIV